MSKSSSNLLTDLKLLKELTKREYKIRYLGSLLGSYWNIIHPIVMILIYTLVFSQVMQAKLGADAGKFSYSLYLCSGLLAWNYFQEIITKGTNAILDNATFIKKMPFPPIILFGANLLSAAINFAIAFSIFLIVLYIVKPVPLGMFITYIAVLVLMSGFAFGVSVGFGCFNVFLRDVQQFVSVLFQLWFWFTPIVYLSNLLPETALWFLHFNPAWAFIEPLHQLFYFQKYPDIKYWLLMFAWTTASLTIGLYIYKKTIHSIRDQI